VAETLDFRCPYCGSPNLICFQNEPEEDEERLFFPCFGCGVNLMSIVDVYDDELDDYYLPGRPRALRGRHGADSTHT